MDKGEHRKADSNRLVKRELGKAGSPDVDKGKQEKAGGHGLDKEDQGQ